MMPLPIKIALLLFLSLSFASSQPFMPYSKGRDCSKLVKASHTADYNWTDSKALALAQCLIHTTPLNNACVFYTSGSKENAVRYAAETNRTTIYDTYLPRWFDINVDPMKRWKRDGKQRDVFRITSKAYALACQGSASVVMPVDEDACPNSIWLTDEYEVIRRHESKIELPIWRVSWAQGGPKGVWKWMVKVLSANGGIRVRGLMTDVQEILVKSTEDSEREVQARMQKLREAWGWSSSAADEDDGWALKHGSCGR